MAELGVKFRSAFLESSWSFHTILIVFNWFTPITLSEWGKGEEKIMEKGNETQAAMCLETEQAKNVQDGS